MFLIQRYSNGQKHEKYLKNIWSFDSSLLAIRVTLDQEHGKQKLNQCDLVVMNKFEVFDVSIYEEIT
jgi:hypothetical protein